MNFKRSHKLQPQDAAASEVILRSAAKHYNTQIPAGGHHKVAKK